MKAKLIEDILQAISAGGGYITGDFVFFLAFRTESELVKIIHELNIKIPYENTINTV